MSGRWINALDATTDERGEWNLDAARKHDNPSIEVVGGPHPYLWIGDERTGCFGVMGGYSDKGRAELVALRDALTVALRRKSVGGDAPEGQQS